MARKQQQVSYSRLLFAASLIVNCQAYRRVEPNILNSLVSSGNASATTHQGLDHISYQRWEGQSRRLLSEQKLGVVLSQQQRDLGSMDQRSLSPEDHLVTSLPLLDEGKFPTRHYAGHIDASADGDKKLFYWLFEPDFSDSEARKEEDTPLVIWLNGGPGCSSMDGLFLENGPFRIVPPQEVYEHSAANTQDTSKWRIEINPYSWHKAPAYTLYIDQPVGTGLSFSKNHNWATNDLEVNVDFYIFLQNFLMLHKDKFVQDSPISNHDGQTLTYQMSRPLFFSGESHAGHYIPSMIDHILEQNDQLLGVKQRGSDRGLVPLQGKIIVSVQGGAIGNGWVDPVYQYSAAKAAYGMGLIDDAQLNALKKKEITCQEDLRKGSYVNAVCFQLLDDITGQSDGGETYTVSSYDNRRWEYTAKPRVFPPGYTVVESFLGNVKESPFARGVTPAWDVDSVSVLNALHAGEATKAGQFYSECTDPPYDALSHQDGKGVVPEVVRVLDHPGIDGNPIQLLFFSGVHDLICNHAANEDFLTNLPWSETKNWIVSERFVWRAGDLIDDGHPVGYMKQHKNLHFLKVLNAGHMVPMDQPRVSLKMITTFIYRESFKDVTQRLERSILKSETCECPQTGVVVSSDDKDVLNPSALNQNVASNSVILFAWVAAMFAVAALFLYAVMKRRRRNSFVLAARDDYESEFDRDVNSIEVM